jgi:hypothetical protein
MIGGMATDEQLAFADRAGRFYGNAYNIPPVAGRLLGYLAVCEPAEQTINDLADALLASRSAITGAVKMLEPLHAVRRTRAAGERVDRVAIDPAALEPQGFRPEPYLEMTALAREGLALAKDPPRRAILEEVAAMGEFLAERMPQLLAEWRAIRAKLRTGEAGLPLRRDPGHGVLVEAAHVGGEPAEQRAERADLGLLEAVAQLRVKGDRRPLQPFEQGPPVLGELDHVDAPVVRVAAAGDQPARVHRVQVMGEGGLADTDRLGELTLVVGPVDGQVEQDEPDRQRAAGLLERVVERAADHTGSPPELKANGNPLRSHAVSIPQ